ncbi:MAG: hypothetical protein NWQ31_11975, partial [Polaribacter sp.]|nr:hypothetical protein [Polaribacter sp.]
IQGDSSLKEIDFLVVKMNTIGEILWYKAYGDGRHDFAKQVLVKSNNNIRKRHYFMEYLFHTFYKGIKI